jgi:nucleotide-binding universal stress UspA family protein
MFSKMLVATDLTETSDFVVAALKSLRRIGMREALLVHCYNIRDTGILTQQLIDLVGPCLRRQEERLKEHGFAAASKLVLGRPHIEIARQAGENSCSLIVVGARSRSLVGEKLLGGVASDIIHFATFPVLVLHLPQEFSKTRDRGDYECDCLHHVLFPTDFSDNAEHAFSYVKKLAEFKAECISLLHVQDEAKLGTHLRHRIEEFNALDTERLNRMRAELLSLGAGEVTVEIVLGSPKKEILKRVNEGSVTLSVMGSQGRGYAGDVFLGSVSHAVARKARTSLLLIPAIQ